MSMKTLSQTNASEIMSEYMLKGWVLTNDVCRKEGCVVPLLRSKLDKTARFCANCDPLPAFTQKNGTILDAAKLDDVVRDLPTNELVAKYSPEFVNTEFENKDDDDEEWVVQEESEASKARREQGSLASKLMGPKLLQGYTMLDTHCPNATCYGIPLLRDRAQKTHCVICENTSLQQAPVPCSNGMMADKSKPLISTSPELQQTASSVNGMRKHAAVDGIETKADDDVCKSTLSVAWDSCSESTTQTLSRKLEWLRNELETETDLIRIQQLCVTLEFCVKAVRTIAKAQRAVRTVE